MPRFESKDGSFFEIEREGTVVRWIVGSRDQPGRVKEKTFTDEHTARYEVGRLLKRHLAMYAVGEFGATAPYRTAVPSRVLPAPTPEPVGSAILLDEYYAQGDDRFLDELLRSRQGAKLAALADKWFDDKRPWARAMLLAYVDDGCDRPDHKGLVKRLFKKAEQASDDELVARFMVAFDQMAKTLFVTRMERTEPEIRPDPEVAPFLVKDDWRCNRFTRVTRGYLERRAYRYFRNKGYREPAAYIRGILQALPHYRDEPLATPAGLLAAWGLSQALYGGNEALRRDPRGLKLKPDASLADLVPAPRWPDAWKDPGLFDALFGLLARSHARTVRAWTVRWLRSHFAKQLASLPFAFVKGLLLSEHEEVQSLGAELFKNLTGLEKLSMTEWLELLAVENIDVVEVVAAIVAKHVSPARMTLAQAIEVACARTAPVAALGLAWAKTKKVEKVEDLVTIAKITRAGVPAVRSDGTQWATQLVTSHPQAKPEHLRDLVDAPHADAREQALAAVENTPKLATPELWFALTESPFKDVRDVVVGNARKWREGATPKTLRHVWTTALLAVNTGSQSKRRVPKQIAERIASHPGEAAELLPILRVALRSVRPPERATALAALVRAIAQNPELRTLAQTLVPELTMTEQVTA